MYYNYYNTDNFNKLREELGFTRIEKSVYIGPYKYTHFLNNKLLFNLFKTIFPYTYIEKDLTLTNKKGAGISFSPIPGATKHYTFIIDLEKELNLDRSIRKNIAKTEGFSVSIVSSKEELKEYYKLYKTFRKSLGFKYDSYELVEKMYDILKENYKIFVCKKNNKIYSALGIIINYDEKSFIEVSAVRDNESKQDNELLKYEIINWAKQNGLRYYDLAGVNPEGNEKDLNIYKYKKKWGGELKEYYIKT